MSQVKEHRTGAQVKERLEYMAEGFAKAIEALAHLPAKGYMPTKDEIAKLSDLASNFEPSNPDELGRQIPTQEEVRRLVAAIGRSPQKDK